MLRKKGEDIAMLLVMVKSPWSFGPNGSKWSGKVKRIVVLGCPL
jgi:hypothetical protein